ncbi:unnamed protein product [Staurois parvus]|uniref:Uncharacterized protein n=1 Tax=Staurois parvus TaxID=386267 RepID=A0ABN9BEZ6_9NEOB|nr:unnamed protein product [Staurois parvus]
MLCIRCSSALISLTGSNLTSISGSNLISFLAAISSVALVTEGRFHTWMSSDSQLTGPLIHHAPKHSFSLSFLFSPTLCKKTPPLHEYTNIYAV